jgi:quinol monooxygenase YgiN
MERVVHSDYAGKETDRREMIISLIELVPGLDTRQAMVEILQFVESRLAHNPGCVGSRIYEGLDGNHTILYVEQWESEQALYNHIRSSLYLPVLNAIDLARSEPKISFHEASNMGSMDLIEALRNNIIN